MKRSDLCRHLALLCVMLFSASCGPTPPGTVIESTSGTALTTEMTATDTSVPTTGTTASVIQTTRTSTLASTSTCAVTAATVETTLTTMTTPTATISTTISTPAATTAATTIVTTTVPPETAAATTAEPMILTTPVTTELQTIATEPPTERVTAATAQPVQRNADTPVLQVALLVNQEREKRGLVPLRYSDKLGELAQVRTNEITSVFEHTRPDGRSCFSIFDDYGIDYRCIAENIAAGQDTPEIAMEWWINSEGHRNNILNPDLRYIGVGNVSQDGVQYWTQIFADADGLDGYPVTAMP